MKNYVALIILLFVVLLVYALLPRLNPPLSEAQARAFVLQDLNSIASSSAPVESRILSAMQTDGSWEFDVLVTTNAHSPCPTVERRLYKLPPVSFRPEPFITSCYYRNRILFREEAVIDSAKNLSITDGYGCAFKTGPDFLNDSAYCPKADVATLSSFASGLQDGVWVAFWEYGANNTQSLIALDENGNVLKTA